MASTRKTKAEKIGDCLKSAKACAERLNKSDSELIKVRGANNDLRIEMSGYFQIYVQLNRGHKTKLKTEFAAKIGANRSTFSDWLATADVIEATGDKTMSPKTAKKVAKGAGKNPTRKDISRSHAVETSKDETRQAAELALEYAKSMEAKLKHTDIRLIDKDVWELLLKILSSSKDRINDAIEDAARKLLEKNKK